MGNQYLLLDIGEQQYAVPMEYVGYIVPSKGEYPCCTLPQMPFYINRVMSMEKKLVTVIDLENIEKRDIGHKEIRPLVLVLNYQNRIIGLQADRITLMPEKSEPKLTKDELNQCSLLHFSGKDFILLNVPHLLEKISTKEEYDCV